MFYELEHSLRTDLIKTEMGIDFSYPLHLHDSFEYITVLSGEMEVTVDKNKYTLCAGDSLLIFPNQLHDLVTRDKSSHFLCIFSPKLVQEFSKMTASKIPESNAFLVDSFYINRLLALDNESMADKVAMKGLLYSICGEFNKGATYVEQKSKRDDLLSRIFKYVGDNFRTDCTLRSLSAELSYNYVYLSKFFKQCTNITFIEYVNRHRVEEACYLLKNSDQTVLQIAYDCGFDSLRSFNRNFKAVTSLTPSEYQNKVRNAQG